MGSGWFDCPLSTYLEEKQGVQGAFALVRCSFRNHIIVDIEKCVEFFNMFVGVVRLSYRTYLSYLEEKQGVQSAFALVRCSSSASNLLEPSRTTSLQNSKGVQGV